MRNVLLIQVMGLLGAASMMLNAQQEIAAGAGSYSSVRPEECESLPKEIFKVESLKGATPTNQWWSSLVWGPHSQNLFPHPLGMVCHEEGMAVTYPGAGIDGRSGNIMGGGVSKGGDFVIGHSASKKFPDTRLAGYSAWMITTEVKDGDARMQLTFGHGSPFVYGRISGGNAVLRFAHKPIVWSGDQSGNVMGITVRGNHYGIFGAAGSQWKSDDTIYENEGSKGYFSIALLPDQEKATLADFAECAHNHVVMTKVSSAHEKGVISSTYEWETEKMEGKAEGSIFALYPHQWKYSSANLGGTSYRSVRGEMKILKGSSFETSVPIQGLLPMFPKEGIPDVERMTGYLKAEAAKKNTDFGDTYWEGKHLGKLATLSGIAEVIGEKALQDQFVAEIRSRLENWFTASAGEKAPLFYYDSNWGTLIGSRPSYGSDAQLNDHHFHYGYFLRAAAEVARLDSAWAKKWGPMVNLLIRDIASPKKGDPLFPYLRCFDLYAGHSWASGHAKFGDGNNQESSSESMNAWYGMMLWGEATGDDVARDLGIYLYNTERTAVEEYWFDVSGTNFPKDFPNVALGMIWGGKGAFATWFSGDIDCIHGINWLPFTPASIYMGRFPAYVKKNHDRIVAKREKGADYNNGWGDLVAMFGALNDPVPAVKYLDATPDCSLEGGNTHAFMYHWLNTLGRFGQNEASVTADHPYVNVFKKDGKKTYVVYNFDEKPLSVRFSDGGVVKAISRGLTVKSD
ncbi:glycosyl hydrolase [Akkermansiaceae bacterium]|nr:glycosyl hydrolase [Akkermansiaceae bacterium]